MKSCKEKAAEWGISSRAVNDMCKKGKVAGACAFLVEEQLTCIAKKKTISNKG